MLEVYARAKIRDQEETLFEPRMHAMMRREIRASDNRHVPFEIKNAIAAEQTRILTADLYKRARDRNHDHPRAVRILARAWLHVIWRCWQEPPSEPAWVGPPSLFFRKVTARRMAAFSRS